MNVGADWLAYRAITSDEPAERALEYLATAHERLDRALARCRDQQGKRLLPSDVEGELAGLKLVLMALAMAADPKKRTTLNLKLSRRRGRPKRTGDKILSYRRAASELLERKLRGYDAAVLEIAKETGLDRSEIEAWASHLEHQQAAIAIGKIALFFRSAI